MSVSTTFRRWLREPLWRFVAIGLALLAIDRLVRTDSAISPPAAEISLTAKRRAALAEAFRTEHGRAPRSEELAAILDRWVDEEVLYREALALGLDRRDAIVQRQLTRKMRFLIEDATPLAEPTRETLEDWLVRHPERYGHPPSVSFEHVFLGRGRRGAALEADAAELAHRLRREPGSFVGLGDPFVVGQVVTDADETEIRKEFGAGFGEAVGRIAPGEWSGPIPSAFGLHLVRVVARSPFRAAELDEVADRVRRDVALDAREARNRAAVAELRARYRVTIEGDA